MLNANNLMMKQMEEIAKQAERAASAAVRLPTLLRNPMDASQLRARRGAKLATNVLQELNLNRLL